MRTDRWDDMFSNISILLAMLIESDVVIINSAMGVWRFRDSIRMKRYDFKCHLNAGLLWHRQRLLIDYFSMPLR